MKNGKSIDYRISSFTLYSNRKLVIIISALIVLMVTDISLIRAYDIISKQLIPIDTRDILFGIISIVCLVAEYLLLELIKPPPGDERGKIRLHVILLYKVTKAVQYVIGAIVVFVILQILFSSYYNTAVLLAIILCSYTLSIGILSVFISRILTLRRNTIFTFLFVLALGSITINASIAVVDVSLRLGDRPPETRAFFGGSSDISKGKYNTMDESYFISYIISFVSAWIATAILLSNYYRKLGKIKYLFITISPMVFFIGQFAAFFTNEISSIINVDQFFLASLTTFITTLSKPLGGLMLGIAFWSMSRMGKSHTVWGIGNDRLGMGMDVNLVPSVSWVYCPSLSRILGSVFR